MSMAIFPMALIPSWGFELWAALPVATSLNRTIPLWAVTTSKWVGSPTTAASGRKPEATRCATPSWPNSSPMVKATEMVAFRSRTVTTLARARNIAVIDALVSQLPRPYRRSSWMRGVNGSTWPWDGGTVSVCASNKR
jgi:hypothetical protein